MITDFERIIFIDDDTIHNSLGAQFVKRYLKNDNIQILKFINPVEALEFIRREQVNDPVKTIIFLDINMPGKSGWDVLDEFELIKESAFKNVTIYMLSSSVDPQDKIKALQNALVTDYLEKPLMNHLSKVFAKAAAMFSLL